MIMTRGVATILSLVLLAGCGSGVDEATSDASTSPSVVLRSEQPTVLPGSGLATTSAATSPAVTSPAASTPPASTSAGAVAFSSPSGNIGCYVDSTGARCDIESSTFQIPQKPASCLLAWGHGLEVDQTTFATFVCAGDTTLGARTVLTYGSSTTVGEFECTSEESGMTCLNLATNHGFRLSKAIADVF